MVSVVTACTTFGSAVSYAFMRDTYKFSQREYDHQFSKKFAAFLFYIGFNVAFYYLFALRNDKEEDTDSRQPRL